MIVHEVPQRSEAWHALRLGKLTASRAADLCATLKGGGEAASRRNLRTQLLLERLTQRSQEPGYVSQAMIDGIEREDTAIGLYEATTGTITRPCGFIEHEEIPAGYSPDAVVGEFAGLVEAKCPIDASHWQYLKTGTVPPEYLAQIVHALWIVPTAAWCDFVSYSPHFPERLQLQIVRVEREPAAIAAYERLARAFLAEIDRELAAVATLTDLRGTLARCG